jgi:PilZ domain-containing protein
MAHYEQLTQVYGLRDAVLRSARSIYELLGNRRRFDRTPFAGTVLLTWRTSVVERTEYCSSVDLSPRGIGIECQEPLRLESIVELLSGGAKRLARVRYCRAIAGGYRIGLEFLTETSSLR